MDHIVESTLEIYQELFSVQFEKKENSDVWHEDVQFFIAYDKESNDEIGQFYIDLFPREGKYGHAAAFPLIKRALIEGKIINPVAAMVCNFNKPTKENPSLLNY